MASRRKKRAQYREVEYYHLSPETKKGIFIIFLFTIALISILSFLSLAGTAGLYIDWVLGLAFGWGRFIVPIILIFWSYVLIRSNTYKVTLTNYIGSGIFIVCLHGLLHLKLPIRSSYDLIFSGLGGGFVGYAVSYPLISFLGFWASLLILIALLISSVLLTFNTSIEKIFEKTNIFKMFQPVFKKKALAYDNMEDEEEIEVEDEKKVMNVDDEKIKKEPTEAQTKEVKFMDKEILKEKNEESYHQIKNPHIQIDLPYDLLDAKQSKPTSGDIEVGMEKISHTLKNFNIPVEMGEVKVGPTVTQYTLKPAEGIKLSRITALNNDLALSLAAHPIRIEAPIPGKSLVGIEVPNQKPAIVRVHEILQAPSFQNRKSDLEIALGKDVSGKCWTADIGNMPHLLVAGATGSGKSVCLNSIIISLLYENNPDSLRFILVDPKRVEFPIYNGIPHLLTPVITDVTKTVYALRWLITEMDQRFDILSKQNKRNIAAYNMTAKEKMPYIVVIIDELADLMVSAAAEVEGCIIRLTQMARAVGIHLVVATQRPSVDVITGLIKANIPCRIAFSVASLMDSRTILDSSGAEKLVGKGDMLYVSPQTATPRRMQGAYVSDDEIKRVVNYLVDASNGKIEYEDAITNKPKAGGTSFDFNSDDNDDLFDEAKSVVIQSGKASASLLQRRLRVGYARAARLIDLLEEAGIVGPGDGAKPREILVDTNVLEMEQKDERTEEQSTTTIEEEDEETEEQTTSTIDEEENEETKEQTTPTIDEPEEEEEEEIADEEPQQKSKSKSLDDEIY